MRESERGREREGQREQQREGGRGRAREREREGAREGERGRERERRVLHILKHVNKCFNAVKTFADEARAAEKARHALSDNTYTATSIHVYQCCCTHTHTQARVTCSSLPRHQRPYFFHHCVRAERSHGLSHNTSCAPSPTNLTRHWTLTQVQVPHATAYGIRKRGRV